MSCRTWGQIAVGREGSAYLMIAVDLVRSSKLTLCASCRLMRRSKIHSLDHFVSDCKHARGHDNRERPGGFDVDR